MGAIPKLKVNLVEEMRRVVTDKKKRRALTPILKQSSVKAEIGRRIIDSITERTLKGKDKKDKNFSPYKKSYRASDIFKIFKGSKRKPNLKLTGDMLASINISKITPNGVEIWITDKPERSKASGHIYGDNPNKMAIRDFWGLPSDDEMESIINEAVRDSGALETQASILEEALGLGPLQVGEQEPLMFSELFA